MNKNQFNAIPESERMNRVLEGVGYYCSVHAPNLSAQKKFGADPLFIVHLGLDKANQAKAESFGLKVKPADESIPVPYVKITRKVREGKKAEDVKPSVVDSMQNEVPDTVLIGNGSKLMVKFGTYWYDTQGGGVGTTLFKTQIRDLVRYTRNGDGQLAMDSGGFNIDDFDITDDVDDEIQEDELPFSEPTVEKKSTTKKPPATDPSIFDE